jgi:very-short-patch-repair endonuclease
MSLPEVLLWRILRGQPEGVKFRRQHPLGPYVLDFNCSERKIAVEVEGIAHDMGDRPERDAGRAAWLREHNVEVIRIPARDVLRDAEAAADSIVRLCTTSE